jgi:hypothetical protein
MKKKKKITVTVKNKHLDALESLLYFENTKEENDKYMRQAKKLWTVLVKAYDKK